MRIISADAEAVLQIGKQGENASTQIDFSAFAAACLADYGAGTLTLVHQRKTDEGPYAIALSNNVWTVTSADVAVPGTGLAELTYTVGSVVRKSLKWKTCTLGALGETVTPPAAWQGYVDRVIAETDKVLNMSAQAVTLAAGSSATVTKSTDQSGNVLLSFGIPKGADGRDGSDASVTAENIANALGYTPADNAALNDKMDSRNPVGSGHLSIGRKADTAIGTNSVALGYDTSATKSYAIAAGKGTVSSGIASHSEGSLTTASGFSSHAEGNSTTASGVNSHAEGTSTRADGTSSHAGGHSTQGDDGPIYTEAKGYASFAHGIAAKATGNVAFATGQLTKANGTLSMTGGNQTVADGRAAAAMGNNTHATQDAQFVVGYANNPQNDSIFEVGNGLDADGNPGSSSNAEPATRQNAFRVTKDGKAIAQTGLQIGDTAIDEETLQEITELPESVSQLNEDIAELQPLLPETAPSAVGKILKVLSVNDDGTFTCEWADAPSGSSTDVQINGTSITQDGVANIPYSTTQQAGVVKTYMNNGVYVNSANGQLAVVKADDTNIAQRNNDCKPIVPSNLVKAVDSVLTSTTASEALTTTEQANARKRIGLDKEWTNWSGTDASPISVDLSGCTELIIAVTVVATGASHLTSNIGNLVYNIAANGTRTFYGRWMNTPVGIECCSSTYSSSTSKATSSYGNGYSYSNDKHISDITSISFTASASITSCDIKIYAR